VPIHEFIKGTDDFPIQKYAIFRNFKEIGGIIERGRAGVSRKSYSADLSRL